MYVVRYVCDYIVLNILRCVDLFTFIICIFFKAFSAEKKLENMCKKLKIIQFF